MRPLQSADNFDAAAAAPHPLLPPFPWTLLFSLPVAAVGAGVAVVAAEAEAAAAAIAAATAPPNCEVATAGAVADDGAVPAEPAAAPEAAAAAAAATAAAVNVLQAELRLLLLLLLLLVLVLRGLCPGLCPVGVGQLLIGTGVAEAAWCSWCC